MEAMTRAQSVVTDIEATMALYWWKTFFFNFATVQEFKKASSYWKYCLCFLFCLPY